MELTETITSIHNPRIKKVASLREKKERDSQKLMIIDGYRAINLALNSGVSIKELFYCAEFFKSGNEKNLIGRVKEKGARIFHLPEKVFRKIAYGDTPEGILAVSPQVKKELVDLPIGKSTLYLILEAVEKPGNLGAILRTADATRVDGVIVCDNQTDIYNPNCLRSSLGAFFTLPVVQTSSQKTIQWLKEHRVKIIATTPRAKVAFTKIDYRNSCSIVLGSEDKGISPAWLEAADFKIKIPMRGQVDSLNVSVAAAIILYEALRQKS